jgi:hypothetical protein
MKLIGSYLYVGDYNNNKIRKVDVTTGNVTTFSTITGPWGMDSDSTYLYVARTGWGIAKVLLSDGTASNFAGDPNVAGTTDGPYASAKFYYVPGISVVGGTIYAEGDGIRKLEAGMVTTFVGRSDPETVTEGDNANLFEMRGITGDGTYLYVTAHTACVVMKITIATGHVEVLAGAINQCGIVDGIGGAARMHYPWGITLAGDYLYVAEQYGNCLIRRIHKVTGVVDTFAGNGYGHLDGIGTSAQFKYPTGITTDGSSLYVTEHVTAHEIRKIDIATQQVTTLAGSSTTSGFIDGIGASARFYNPAGLVYSNGALYVSDYSNYA